MYRDSDNINFPFVDSDNVPPKNIVLDAKFVIWGRGVASSSPWIGIKSIVLDSVNGLKVTVRVDDKDIIFHDFTPAVYGRYILYASNSDGIRLSLVLSGSLGEGEAFSGHIPDEYGYEVRGDCVFHENGCYVDSIGSGYRTWSGDVELISGDNTRIRVRDNNIIIGYRPTGAGSPYIPDCRKSRRFYFINGTPPDTRNNCVIAGGKGVSVSSYPDMHRIDIRISTSDEC